MQESEGKAPLRWFSLLVFASLATSFALLSSCFIMSFFMIFFLLHNFKDCMRNLGSTKLIGKVDFYGDRFHTVFI